MNTIKKLFSISLLSILALAASAQISGTNLDSVNLTNVPTAFAPLTFLGEVLPAWNKDLTNSFGSTELEISAGATWKSATAAGTTPYAALRGDYMFTRNFGLGAEVVTLGNGTGSSTVDSTSAYFKARIDSGNLAGYIIASVGEDYNVQQVFGGIGPGVEYRNATGFGVFVDTRVSIYGKDSKQNGFLTTVGVTLPLWKK